MPDARQRAPVDYSACLLNPDNSSEVDDVAQMHTELLSWGPVARLGKLFLRRYCYSLLVREGLLKVIVSRVAAKPAGFVAYTTVPGDFLSRAIRRHPARVALLMLVSVVIRPATLAVLAKAVRPARHRMRGQALLPKAEAEIMAIGVYPEYRSMQFIRRTELRISRDLFFRVVASLRAEGFRSVQMDVDAFNKEALLFYHGLGGRLESFDRFGDSMYRIVFDLADLGPHA